MAMTNFEKAFAAARKAGKANFTFGGKSYNTKLKADAPKSMAPKARPAPVVGPKARPSNSEADYNKRRDAAKAAVATKVAPTAVKTNVKAQTPIGKRSDNKSFGSNTLADKLSAIRKGNQEQRKEREAARKARRAMRNG